MNTPANSSRERRLDELATAWLKALEAGENTDQQEWLQRYPDLADELQAFVTAHQQVADIVPQRKENLPGPATIGHEDATHSTLGTIRYFGDYELLEEIARGGMGVVFKARQVSLNRIVALKMILKGELANEAEVRRFRREAEAAANLDHPNIVPIYEIGEHEGQQYFSMKLIEREARDQNRGTSKEGYRRLATALAKVAQAVHHAHQHGILHRDLKPNNILIDQQGEPHVVDFGLAKRVSEQALTHSGLIVGTPSYMAPEQVRAEKGVTTAVDVYSLGAVLYEWVTGKPPFAAATPLDTLMEVVAQEAAPPSKLQPKTPRDLEIICLKCLRKEPDKRYGSALELADDLRRFERGEPILARRVGRVERAWRWVKRKPALATALAASLALLVVAIVFGLVQWRTNTQLTSSNQQLEYQFRMANYCKIFDRALALWKEHDVAGTRQLLNSLDPDLRSWEWNFLERQCQRKCLELPGHVGPVTSAQFSKDGTHVLSAGADGTIRLWELQEGQEILSIHGCKGKLIAAFFGGDRIVAGGDDGLLKCWDNAGIEIWSVACPGLRCLAVSADGQQLVTGGADHFIRIWDVAKGTEVLAEPKHKAALTAVQFSADGRFLASAGEDKSIHLWDAKTFKEMSSATAEQTPIRGLAFNPEGTILATLQQERITFLDLASAKVLRRIEEPGKGVVGGAFPKNGIFATSSEFSMLWPSLPALWGFCCLAMHPGTGQCALGSNTGILKIWSPFLSLRSQSWSEPADISSNIALSPDGTKLAYALRNTIKIREVNGGSLLRVISGVAGDDGRFLVFAPDGKRFANLNPRHVRIWDAATLQELQRIDGTFHHVCFHPTRPNIICTAVGHRVYWWDLLTGKTALELEVTDQLINALAFSPDGRFLACGCSKLDKLNYGRKSKNGTVQFWEFPSRRSFGLADGQYGGVTALAFSPNGKNLLFASEDDTTLQIWDIEGEKHLQSFIGAREKMVGVCADGKSIFTWSTDRGARMWDIATGKETNAGKLVHDFWRPPILSPKTDAAILISGSSCSLWDLQTIKKIGHLAVSENEIRNGAFSADAKWLVTFSDFPLSGSEFTPGKLTMRDALSGRELQARTGHFRDIRHLTFTPDGRGLVAASDSRDQVRHWEWETQKQLRELCQEEKRDNRGHSEPLHPRILAFTDDGRFLVYRGAIWDWPTGKKLHDIESKNEFITAGAIGSRGNLVVTSSVTSDRSLPNPLKIWDIATGRQLRRLNGVPKKEITSLAFSPDGKLVASSELEFAGVSDLKVWDATNGDELFLLPVKGQISGLQFSPDSKRIIVSARSSSEALPTKVWDARSRQEVFSELTHAGRLCVSKNGSRLFCFDDDDWVPANRALVEYDAAAGEAALTLVGHKEMVCSLSFSPDGHRLASCTRPYFTRSGNEARVWNLKTGDLESSLDKSEESFYDVAFTRKGDQLFTSGEPSLNLWNAGNGRLSRKFLTQRLNAGASAAGAVSFDGSWIASVGETEEIILRDAATNNRILAFGETQNPNKERWSGIALLTFSRNGRFLADARVSDHRIRLWDLSCLKEDASFRQIKIPYGYYGSGQYASFSPDSRTLLSDESLWDVLTGQKIITLERVSGSIYAAAFTGDGKHIIGGGADKVLYVWETATGRKLRMLRGHTDSICAIAISPDGRYAASGGAEGLIHIWDLGFLSQAKKQ